MNVTVGSSVASIRSFHNLNRWRRRALLAQAPPPRPAHRGVAVVTRAWSFRLAGPAAWPIARRALDALARNRDVLSLLAGAPEDDGPSR